MNIAIKSKNKNTIKSKSKNVYKYVFNNYDITLFNKNDTNYLDDNNKFNFSLVLQNIKQNNIYDLFNINLIMCISNINCMNINYPELIYMHEDNKIITYNISTCKYNIYYIIDTYIIISYLKKNEDKITNMIKEINEHINKYYFKLIKKNETKLYLNTLYKFMYQMNEIIEYVKYYELFKDQINELKIPKQYKINNQYINSHEIMYSNVLSGHYWNLLELLFKDIKPFNKNIKLYRGMRMKNLNSSIKNMNMNVDNILYCNKYNCFTFSKNIASAFGNYIYIIKKTKNIKLLPIFAFSQTCLEFEIITDIGNCKLIKKMIEPGENKMIKHIFYYEFN